MTKTKPDLGRMAEAFIDTGQWDADAIAALDDNAIDELFEQLLAYSAVATAAEKVADDETATLDEEQASAALRLHSYYLGKRADRASEPAAQKLARPATWLAIEPVVRDRDFLIRLQQRRLRDLGARFVMDLADLLGQSRAAVRDYLAQEPGYGLATAENRNRGKLKDDGAEDFRTALARSGVPEPFKSRWLKDAP